VIATAEAQRKAADLARRSTGWTVWVTAQGSPVATRSGRQRPPEPYDGNWAQTIMADDWDELETELAAQAKYDEERLTNQTTHGLQYQLLVLVDHSRAYELPIELSAWWSLLTTHGGVTSRTL
jgi:hypothetical protein